MKLNGGRRVVNTPPPSSMIPPNCWGGKRVIKGWRVTTRRPVVVALHPPRLSMKTPGNNDERRHSPSSSSPSPRLLSPFPFPSPSSILPHHCHLHHCHLLHSVVMWRWWRSMWWVFDVWAVVVTWRRRWASLVSSAAGDVAWLAALAWRHQPSSLALLGAGDVALVGGVVGGIWGP